VLYRNKMRSQNSSLLQSTLSVSIVATPQTSTPQVLL
jgi:hypothetical protein